jgi:hypothetical protein
VEPPALVAAPSVQVWCKYSRHAAYQGSPTDELGELGFRSLFDERAVVQVITASRQYFDMLSEGLAVVHAAPTTRLQAEETVREIYRGILRREGELPGRRKLRRSILSRIRDALPHKVENGLAI